MLRTALGRAAPAAKRAAAPPARSFVKPTSAKKIDHHAALVITSVITYAQATHSVLARGWLKRLADQEPVVVFSLMLGGIGIMLPVTVVPLRRSLGMNTSQYDGATGGVH